MLEFSVKCKSFLRSFASLPRTASDYCVIFVVLATLIHSVISLLAFNKYRGYGQKNQEKTGNWKRIDYALFASCLCCLNACIQATQVALQKVTYFFVKVNTYFLFFIDTFLLIDIRI